MLVADGWDSYITGIQVILMVLDVYLAACGITLILATCDEAKVRACDATVLHIAKLTYRM